MLLHLGLPGARDGRDPAVALSRPLRFDHAYGVWQDRRTQWQRRYTRCAKRGKTAAVAENDSYVTYDPAGRPLESRPSAGLTCGVCACVAVGTLLPFSPVAPWLGFTTLPPLFFAILVLMIVNYLALVEGAKRWFYRLSPM